MLTKVQWLPGAIDLRPIREPRRDARKNAAAPADGPAATAADSADRGAMGTRVIHPGININVAARCRMTAAPNWRGCFVHERERNLAACTFMTPLFARADLFMTDDCGQARDSFISSVRP